MNKLNFAYNVLKRFIKQESNSPIYLIFFITSKCIAHCQHCFFWKKSNTFNDKDYLSLDEIEKIAISTRSLGFLLLTGGEPFLRDELPEIAGIFYKHTPVRNIAVPTNGLLGNKIVTQTEAILKYCPEAKLTVNVSIDGIGELHDQIRGVKGIFDKAIETYKELILLKKKYNNFNVGIITTISHLNQDHIIEIHNFVRNKLNVPIWAPFLTRGNPRNPEMKIVDPDKYLIANELLKEDIKKGLYEEYTNFLFARINSAKNVVRRELIAKIMKEKKYFIPCYAGKLNGILYPDGELYPCELLDSKIGNIRDFDLNMKKAWTSIQAKNMREKIDKSKCFCTHECFLTTNILYNYKYYPEIFYWWYKFL